MLILPMVNIKYVLISFLNFLTLGRLVLPHVNVAERLGGLPIIRGVLSSNADAAAIIRLLHAISLCQDVHTIVCVSASITKFIFFLCLSVY